ncbi:50S ribosomal protein L29 [candidate division KSB1 bacterium]|nr:50S ribosomal protein L29 [candidate division KSB1 bacterium]
MRIEEIRQMSIAEMEQTLEDKLEAMQNLKFQHATHQLDNPLSIRLIRRDIARLKSVLNELNKKQTTDEIVETNE